MSAKVLAIFGTRPEAIKLFPVIHALKARERIDTRVCVTGQHQDLLRQVLELTEIEPDHDLTAPRQGGGLDELVARMLPGLGRVLDEEAPDWVVVQGDTASALAGVLAAYHRRIAICHVEAGLRTGDLSAPWPEEGYRRMIATLAALHCAPTVPARDNLLAEGVSPDAVVVTGNTAVDAIRWVRSRLATDPLLASAVDAIARKFSGRRLVAVTCHRRENHGEGVRDVVSALRILAAQPGIAIVVSLHPNPECRAVFERGLAGVPFVHLSEPLGYAPFARLLDIADVVLTDSGGIQEEAFEFEAPVLVLRGATERPEAIAAGRARLVGTRTGDIVAEVIRTLDRKLANSDGAGQRNPFGDGRSGERIATLLASSIVS